MRRGQGLVRFHPELAHRSPKIAARFRQEAICRSDQQHCRSVIPAVDAATKKAADRTLRAYLSGTLSLAGEWMLSKAPKVLSFHSANRNKIA